MKKIIFALFISCVMSLTAFAQLSCPIYRADGATVTVLVKGGQADGSGSVIVPVRVDNYKENSGEGRSVRVWVEVVDQNTGCPVKREQGIVSIRKHYYNGEGSVRITGLTPNHDYLFRIDSAKMCE